MSRTYLVAVSIAATLWVGAAFAQDASTTPVMASTLAPAKGGATITVTSSALMKRACTCSSHRADQSSGGSIIDMMESGKL